MTSLKGKVALVTGSTSGIGEGIAEVLARAGCGIMLNGFGDPDAIQEQKDRLSKNYGVKVHYHGANLAKPAETKTLIKQTLEKFNSIDVLVNNAGVQHKDRVENFPDNKWDTMMAINLSAAFHTIKASLPTMKKQEWGRVINIASAHGLRASEEKAAYVAAKHGVLGLTKVVALENAQSNITCNAICPGWVLTPLVQQQIDVWAEEENISLEEAQARLLAEKQPSLRFTQPEEVGDMVLYLCSDAAKNVTGSHFNIDGGWTAR